MQPSITRYVAAYISQSENMLHTLTLLRDDGVGRSNEEVKVAQSVIRVCTCCFMMRIATPEPCHVCESCYDYSLSLAVASMFHNSGMPVGHYWCCCLGCFRCHELYCNPVA